MGDHLFETRLLEAFVRQANPELLNLAVDRKISSIFDLDDAMKVQTYRAGSRPSEKRSRLTMRSTRESSSVRWKFFATSPAPAGTATAAWLMVFV